MFVELLICLHTVSYTKTYNEKTLDDSFKRVYIKANRIKEIIKDVSVHYIRHNDHDNIMEWDCEVVMDEGGVVVVRETCMDLVKKLNRAE